jgi:hypothetical protein
MRNESSSALNLARPVAGSRRPCMSRPERALLSAASAGDQTEFMRLVEENANINASDYEGRTVLHRACAEGHFEIVQMLIDFKAHIDVLDRWGDPPLKLAMRNGHQRITSHLKQAGATLSRDCMVDLEHLACRHAAEGDIFQLRMLIESGVRVDAANYDGRTALHLAAGRGNVEMVELLLSHGADSSLKDRHGRDALDDAIDGGHARIESILRARATPAPAPAPAPDGTAQPAQRAAGDRAVPWVPRRRRPCSVRRRSGCAAATLSATCRSCMTCRPTTRAWRMPGAT